MDVLKLNSKKLKELKNRYIKRNWRTKARVDK